MATYFTCEHTSTHLPPSTAPSPAPRSLPHPCHACMTYSAQGQEAAINSEYGPELSQLTLKINVATIRLNKGAGEEIVEKQRGWMARRAELMDEQRELVDEVWAECERVWGRRG